MLTVSPVLRSSAAMPTSADLAAAKLLSCSSRLERLGLEAANAGCARNASRDRRIATNRIMPLPAYSCADARIIAKRPHSFQIVKISHFGTENMDDHVVRIDQHPVGGRKPFDSNVLAKSLLDLVGKLNSHGRNLPRRAARGDHHMIGNVRFAREGDGDNLLGLVVIERLKDETVKVFDVEGRACRFAGGLSGTF